MNNDGEENASFCGPMIAIGREEVVLCNENSRTTSKGKKSHGFHLVRSKWDPYPWIESVESASSAEISGLRYMPFGVYSVNELNFNLFTFLLN